MDPRTAIQTAKLIAVPLPLILAGYSFTLSQNAVPALYDQSAEASTPVFKAISAAAGSIVVPGTLLSTAASAYLAYVLPDQRNLWTTAAAALFALTPYTALRVFPGSANRLIKISGDKALQGKASANLEHRQLMQKWVRQNYVRVALMVIAGVAGLQATLVDA